MFLIPTIQYNFTTYVILLLRTYYDKIFCPLKPEKQIRLCEILYHVKGLLCDWLNLIHRYICISKPTNFFT